MIQEFWKGKRVFVTGATGLLGSQMTRRLLELGAEVTILLRDQVSTSPLVQSPQFSRINIVRGELQSFETLQRLLNEYEIEYVFHLGAQTQVTHANRQPFATFESNIRGSYNLLEACRLHPAIKGVLVASSDKAYGTQPELPYTEEAPLAGRHPYDVSKSCTDLIAQTYAHSYKVPVCVLRCGNLYGPGDLNFARIIPAAIRAGHEQSVLDIRSDGTFIRDYLYVEDAVDGYLAAAERLHRDDVKGQAFNLGTQNRLSVLDVAKAVGKVFGKPLATNIQNIATNEIRDQYLTSEKAGRVLGWRAKHTIEQGLAKTVPAYRSFFTTRRWE